MRARAAAVLAVLVGIVGALVVMPAARAIPPGGMTASAVGAMFRSYGDAGGHWTGGDSTVSVPLPDGRIAWLFSDTFLGTVNADGTRPRNTPMVNNTIVVQDGTALVATRHGGTAAAPQALVTPAASGEFFWVGDGTVENGALRVLYNSYRRTGGGSLDFTLTGTTLVTIALPGLTVTSITPLSLGSTIAWGSALLEDDGHTYIYGSSTVAGTRFGHLARVPAGGLGGAWQFWTGTGWSSTPAQAGRLLSGVGTGYSVDRIGSQYVLFTQENNLPFDPQYVAYTAPAPTGPFTGPIQLFAAPEQAAGSVTITYDGRLHRELARPGKLLASYNVNSLDNDANYADARLYRPRFVELDWPRPAPDPAAVPVAPGGFTASVDAAGTARLSWQPAARATQYRIHRRDVTAGQTHFARQSTPVTGTTADVGRLTSGHTYEFKVTGENQAGEGPFSAVATVTPQIAPPPAPSSVTATANASGRITVSWAPVPAAWTYEVSRRDVTDNEPEAGVVGRVDGSRTSHDSDNLEPGHVYAFTVTASHGGGTSPPSATVTATATYALPAAPTGLTATANTDGTIRLAWTAPGPDLWYWVYQRDVTAGEAGFTKFEYPVATGTTMTAGYLVHGHEYEYQVSAVNRGGEGPVSATARARSTYPAPAAPTGLTATPGNSEVALRWSYGSTDAWFNVYYRDVTAGETEFTPLPLPVTTCCAFSPGYLANGHEYEFKVTAITQGGESGASNLVRARPVAPLPGAVTALTAAANPDGTIHLAWTPPAGDDLWFEVWQRDVTAGQSNFTKLPLPVPTCCAFDAGALTNAHVYEFKVNAINGGGAGPQSNVARATSRINPPGAPTNLRGATAGDGSVNLDWDAPGPGGFYYWIHWRDVTAGQTTFTKGVYPTDQTNGRIGALVHGHVYEFKVTAENGGGEGPASATVRVTSVGGTPGSPSGLTATAGDGQVTLRWTASPTPNVYYWVYYRDTDVAGSSFRKLDLPVSGTSFTVGYLSNGHTYQFKVVATNASGDGPASNVASARPLPPRPAAPTGLTATAGNGQVTLRWTASSTANVYYWVEYRARGGNWQRLKYPVSACCSFTVGYLFNGTTYDFRVFATNLAGDSAASNTASARPLPPRPAAPTGLTATAGNSRVTLRWTASSTPNVYYWIEYRSTGGWQRLKYPVSSCCSFDVTYLVNNTTYQFRVFATNLAGDSSASNVVSARPVAPMPAEATNVTVTPGIEMVRISWTASPTPGVWYYVWYRNITVGAVVYRRYGPIAATSTGMWNLFTTGDVYEFKVSSYNSNGENVSTSEDFARTLPASAPNRKINTLNGANAIARAWILKVGITCRPDVRQTVCFGPPPSIKGNPITIGDYMFTPRSPASFDNMLVSDARLRFGLRLSHNLNYAVTRGPDLLRHEAVHSEQWADAPMAQLFITAYVAASAESLVRTGNEWCANRFETAANLYWGKYLSHNEESC
jgi:fibronectin type 3 domain-containing protein